MTVHSACSPNEPSGWFWLMRRGLTHRRKENPVPRSMALIQGMHTGSEQLSKCMVETVQITLSHTERFMSLHRAQNSVLSQPAVAHADAYVEQTNAVDKRSVDADHTCGMNACPRVKHGNRCDAPCDQ